MSVGVNTALYVVGQNVSFKNRRERKAMSKKEKIRKGCERKIVEHAKKELHQIASKIMLEVFENRSKRA